MAPNTVPVRQAIGLMLAPSEHGDLLDLIAGVRRLGNMWETLAEARQFLNAPPLIRPHVRRRR